mmetsp:Transcript_6703/g.28096  ORF Transcript_6703/g.28096 Transcript_6703/m.28096 type:complete len:393 (+) Transcript_6703:1894-3072(+)
MARQVAHQQLVDMALAGDVLGQHGLQGFQLVHQLIEPLARDGRGLGGEGRRQGVVEQAHMVVLLVRRHAGLAHAVAQRLQQRRQLADHVGALLARALGAGGPDQVRRGALHQLGQVGLGARTDRRHGQHIGPDVEQEVPHAVLHRHLGQHLAQLDGVLNGQGLALLDLLGQGHAPLGGLVLVLEVVIEELLELGQHRGEHAPAGIGIGLHHLHDPLDLAFQRVGAGTLGAGAGVLCGIEAHHAGTHAVDQAACRMVGGGEEVRLAHGDPQHRHLQPREPDPHRGRDALLGQDALEHHRDDLDGRALGRRARSVLEHLLEGLVAGADLLQCARRASGGRIGRFGARRAGATLQRLLGMPDRPHQPRRCGGRPVAGRRRVGERGLGRERGVADR